MVYWLYCEQPWLGMWISPLLSILIILFVIGKFAIKSEYLGLPPYTKKNNSLVLEAEVH